MVITMLGALMKQCPSLFESEKLMVAIVVHVCRWRLGRLLESEKLMVVTVRQKALNAIVKDAHCFIGVKCFVSDSSCL